LLIVEKHCDTVHFTVLTRDNLKDQKKITGADISRKRRAEGTNKEANDQGTPLVKR